MNSQNNENYIKNQSFLKKVWYSMTKFEKYPEMAACGVPKAFLYLTQMMIIFSIILTIAIFFYINQNYEQTDAGETPYSMAFKEIVGREFSDEEKLEFTELINQYGTKTVSVMFFIVMAISAFISYFLVTLVDILTLSIFGMLTCYMTKIKISYKAIFNMSTYALTISMILRLIYEVLLLTVNFKIKYFNMMYTAIAYICLAAAIFMIKSDVIKQQIELMKVIEEKRKKAEEEQKEDEKEKKDDEEEPKEENKEGKKENKEKDDKNEDMGNHEGQGVNA